jgi:hypothetical protein
MFNPRDLLALDRAASARRIDADGHMRVVGSAVSLATVNPYYGREIPDADRLGLDPDRIYQLYRDPVALKQAADSLNGKPLLEVHKAISANDHDHDVVVGSVDNARWDDPYLRADLTIWVEDAIDAIQSGERRELSCGYRFTAVMRPGTTWDGIPFSGRMQQISYNHVALVEAGRCGSSVMVADSALPTPTLFQPARNSQMDNCNFQLVRELNRAKEADVASRYLRARVVVACDSDAQVWAHGSRSLGYKGAIPRGAEKATFQIQAQQVHQGAGVVMDAKTKAKFPGINKLKLR